MEVLLGSYSMHKKGEKNTEHAQIVRGGDDEHPHPQGVRESGQDLSPTASDDVCHLTGRWFDGGREKHLLTCQQLAATSQLH